MNSDSENSGSVPRRQFKTIEPKNWRQNVQKHAHQKSCNLPAADDSIAYKGGNLNDLEPFFKQDGKYRIASNMSQVQYAANLRNYHPIDYDQIPHRLEKEERRRGRQEQKKRENSSAFTTMMAKKEQSDEDLHGTRVEQSLEK